MKQVKKKRIKKVFSSYDQVLHLWANQSQDDARSKNVFFIGKSCYSYGYHYELGRLVTVNGYIIAMINDRGYSNTTASHIRSAQAATSHILTLNCTNLDDVDSALVRNLDDIVSCFFNKFTQLGFYDNDISYFKENILKDINNHNRICDIVKRSDLKVQIPTNYWNLIQEYINSRVEAIKNSKTPEVLAKKEELKQKKLEIDKVKWIKGEINHNKNISCISPQLIRIKNDEIETTKGARVPLVEAKSLMKKILNNTAKQGDKIGSFMLDSVSNDSVKIGCHVIDLEQAEQVLNHLKLVA